MHAHPDVLNFVILFVGSDIVIYQRPDTLTIEPVHEQFVSHVVDALVQLFPVLHPHFRNWNWGQSPESESDAGHHTGPFRFDGS